jgi:hypothetical protein
VKLLSLTFFLIFGVCMTLAGAPPKNGYVPNEKVAVAIAEAILVPIYGQKLINTEKPFHAKLIDKVWVVEGTLAPNIDGGVATVKISKRDACVLSVMHGK